MMSPANGCEPFELPVQSLVDSTPWLPPHSKKASGRKSPRSKHKPGICCPQEGFCDPWCLPKACPASTAPERKRASLHTREKKEPGPTHRKSFWFSSGFWTPTREACHSIRMRERVWLWKQVCKTSNFHSRFNSDQLRKLFAPTLRTGVVDLLFSIDEDQEVALQGLH